MRRRRQLSPVSHRRPPLAPPYVADGPVQHDAPPVTAHPHSGASPIRGVPPRRSQHGADAQPTGRRPAARRWQRRGARHADATAGRDPSVRGQWSTATTVSCAARTSRRPPPRGQIHSFVGRHKRRFRWGLYEPRPNRAPLPPMMSRSQRRIQVWDGTASPEKISIVGRTFDVRRVLQYKKIKCKTNPRYANTFSHLIIVHVVDVAGGQVPMLWGDFFSLIT